MHSLDANPEYHNWPLNDLLAEVQLLATRSEEVPMDLAVALMGYGLDAEKTIQSIKSGLFF